MSMKIKKFLLIIVSITFLIGSYWIVSNLKNNNGNLAVLVDGEKTDTFPEKGSGYVFEKVECKNGSIGVWNNETWSLELISSGEDKCKVFFSKAIPLADYIKSLFSDTSNGLYLHDNNLENGAKDNSYRFSGSDYLINHIYSSKYKSILGDLIKIKCGDNLITVDKSCNAANTKYILDYDINANEYSYFTVALKKAIADNYVQNNTINNYVCFGSDDLECPSKNLYRIIGVFEDNVKLISADYLTEMELGTPKYKNEYLDDYLGLHNVLDSYLYGNEINGSNLWNESPLNEKLNNQFYNSFDLKWRNMINLSIWKLNGNLYWQTLNWGTYDNYKQEILEARNEYNGYIGLMYYSDYLYANPNNLNRISSGDNGNNSGGTGISRNTNNNHIITLNIPWNNIFSGQHSGGTGAGDSDYHEIVNSVIYNWMYLSSVEYTISCEMSVKYHVVSTSGETIYYNYKFGTPIRPVFYLSSDVKYKSGDGSKENPYRLVI